jgi:hypothetical protein
MFLFAAGGYSQVRSRQQLQQCQHPNHYIETLHCAALVKRIA